MAQAAAGTQNSARSPWAIAQWAVLGVPSVLLLLLAAVVFVIGVPYYFTEPDLRPDHALHSAYGPGNVVGVLLGFVGTSLMLIMLLYSVRKWIPLLGFLGNMQFWMRVHVLCGLIGPLFILLHGGVKLPSGFIGIGFWCMVLVALSGFFGRYLFGYFPQTAQGLRTDLQAAQARLTDLRAQLVTETRDAAVESVGRAVKLVKNFEYEPQSIGELVILDAEVRRRADLVRIMLHRAGVEGRVRRRAEATLLEQLNMRRNLAGWDVARRLLRYWNLFHQPLALAMYVIATVHIGNAIVFGGVLQKLFGGF